MIEYILVLIVVLSFILFSKYNLSYRRIVFQKEKNLSSKIFKLRIAENKYLKGKLKANVFNKLKHDLQYEKVLAELEVYHLKKSEKLEIEEKLIDISKKLQKPTKHNIAKIKRFLFQSELINHEIKFIEKKLMKNEITEDVFERLRKEKENDLIENELLILGLLK
jgi:hypothetical protein